MLKPFRHIHLFASLALVCCAVQPAPAQVSYEPMEGSRLWIEGRSNVNRFTCGATRYDLQADVYRDLTSEPLTSADVAVGATIAVDGFDCANDRMERDLGQSLSADRFPEIRFTFIAARRLPSHESSDGDQRLQVWGDLTVAGVRRGVDFVVSGSHEDLNQVRSQGSVAIRMTDYGIDPPRRLLGLVRVRDQLTVRFDLLLNPSQDETALHTNSTPGQ